MSTYETRKSTDAARAETLHRKSVRQNKYAASPAY